CRLFHLQRQPRLLLGRQLGRGREDFQCELMRFLPHLHFLKRIDSWPAVATSSLATLFVALLPLVSLIHSAFALRKIALVVISGHRTPAFRFRRGVRGLARPRQLLRWRPILAILRAIAIPELHQFLPSTSLH